MSETKPNVESRGEPDDLRLLRGLVPLEEAASVDDRRPRLVASIEREIAAGALRRAARGRRRRGLTVVLAVAAVIVAALGVTRFVSDRAGPVGAGATAHDAASRAWVREARGEVAGGGAPLVRGTVLGVGSALHTSAGGSSELALGERVRVSLAGDTGVELVELSAQVHRVALRSGRVDVNVDKIERAPEELVVETFDTRVEVIGTVFSVAVKESAPGGRVTEVGVTRGRVAVIHAGVRRELGPGEIFISAPRGAEAPGVAVRPEPGERPRVLTAPHSAAGPVDAGAPSPASSPVEASRAEKSTLAEQNRLFERGLEARDRGDDEGAVRAFRELTTKYPGSPLWSAAEEERRRAATRLGR